jgi:hypothetical protein
MPFPARALQAASATAVIALCAVAACKAQTADEIVSRYLTAIGGRAAVAALTTMRYVRTVLNTEHGTTTEQSRRTISRKRPYYYRNEDPTTGRVYIFDGKHAWTGRPSGDGDRIQWHEASFVLRSRDLDFERLLGPFIDFAEKGHEAQYLGHDQRDGVDLLVVRVRWREGDQWDFYFDASTALCYGFTANLEEPDALTRVDDYRRVGSILVAHRNTSVDRRADGGVRLHERRYSDIAFSMALSDSLFVPGRS